MKTKHLYVLTIGLFSFLFILIAVVIPCMFVYYSPVIGASLACGLTLIGILLYIKNNPRHHMRRFNDYPPAMEDRKSKAEKFSYHRSEYPFSCGHAAMQMLLVKHGIIMTQDEILEYGGDPTLGVTSWDLEETLNKIFLQRKVALKARINNFTTCSQLFDALQKDTGVIVMYINNFNEKDFSSEANYPHFALLNKINMSNQKYMNKVVLTSPSFSPDGNKNFRPGKYEGEIIIPFEEFQGRFYASSQFLNCLEYKPICTDSDGKNELNYFTNLLFILLFYIGYCTTILKPGLAIFIEPTEKK
ncbi:MAG: hypothetical protein ACD_80C00073G0003 [uncultured bacterium (gcode 4)]|uniref:Uncharacterized protein n=1 Tax=uncultured bacterium (gcode 4) TaxID=1234023 RepID=K1XJL7_9BACT|nr:MAG: hypothetical protein ACD_80C00073G0003 [uncultured bacterium (gcode 4)]HBB04181.1 hypothetical protein [Candidatus Gracilibacteria bacterium]